MSDRNTCFPGRSTPVKAGGNRGRYLLPLFLAVLLFGLGGEAWGQSATSGVVIGTVMDQSDAVIADAQLELLNVVTNVRRTTASGVNGLYTFPNVTPGLYRLTVTKDGFQTHTVIDVRVEVAKSTQIDVRLEVGELAQTIEVSAEATAALQTVDSTVGDTISGNILPRFPALTRLANELLTLQPLATPAGEVAGARSDQSTFTLDGIDVTNQSIGGLGTYARLPVDGVEEFRVGVANPNAAFGRGSGGQVSVISRSGSRDYHGATYWYHQNDNLNANTWTLNRTKVKKAELKDNRFGFRVGGPVIPWGQLRQELFMFLNYEGRRFPRSSPIARIVPTDTFKQGILRFRDSSGEVRSYNLASSTLCGPAGDQLCDPRGLGLSPSIAALWSPLPSGNDPSLGDGLNTVGFRGTVSNALNNDYYNARVDYQLTSNWRADASFRYFGETQLSALQVNISGGNPTSVRSLPDRQNFATLGLRGQLSPTLHAEFRFGWVRSRTATAPMRPDVVANFLAIPGTDTPDGFIMLDAGAFSREGTFLDEPIDINTQIARLQSNDNRNFQYNANFNWVRGPMTWQFGGNIRRLKILHRRDDKVIGALGALVAQVDSALGVLQIPATSRPPTCSATLTTNCLAAGDVQRWDRFFASALGMIDNISVLAVRDGDFNPLPFGNTLDSDTTLWGPELYVQNVWRVRPSFTLTLGVNYAWQTSPKEKLNRQTIQVFADTLQPVTATSYLNARRNSALRGEIFNPDFAFMPIAFADRDTVFKVDWNNVGPRAAAAWNPAFSNGFLGMLFGQGKTVIRGGFSLHYDRQNTVQSVIVPSLGVGFGQTINLTTPACNSTGSGGAGCNAGSANPVLSVFRVGYDGVIPRPTVPSQTIPVQPFWGIRPGSVVGPDGTFPASAVLFFPEVLSFQVDPDIQVGENFAFDLTWQRELPWNLLVEFGYVGRYARKLPQSMSLGQAPYIHVDPASGQSFAQAFDAVATRIRSGTAASALPAQAWFENNVPSVFCVVSGNPTSCTHWLAATFGSTFVNGTLNSLFQQIDNRRLRAGLDPFNNWMAQTLFLRASTGDSNYNAGFVTVRRRVAKGLILAANYTYSRSLDQFGAVQNAASVMPNNFDLDAEYGRSDFDFTHLFNTTYYYDLPFGRGQRWGSTGSLLDRIVGGWYVSGIFTATSGAPLTVTQGAQVWGGSLLLNFASGAIPTVPTSTLSNSVNSGVAGSGGVGTTGNPATGGTGLNMFGDPEAVFRSFRRVEISRDTRSGRNQVRGLPRWNLDTSIGKRTRVTEQIGIIFSADFFNIFNKVDFNNPGLSLTAPQSFGVITSQFTPANRTDGARWIQFGLRVEF
jgi:hypothetical protein